MSCKRWAPPPSLSIERALWRQFPDATRFFAEATLIADDAFAAHD